jgi:hypothetical protein
MLLAMFFPKTEFPNKGLNRNNGDSAAHRISLPFVDHSKATNKQWKKCPPDFLLISLGAKKERKEERKEKKCSKHFFQTRAPFLCVCASIGVYLLSSKCTFFVCCKNAKNANTRSFKAGT